MLDEIVLHAGCATVGCPQCLAAADVLAGVMTQALGNEEDNLGRYHTWLGKQGIDPETDGGWWTREALSDANAQRYIAWKLEARAEQ